MKEYINLKEDSIFRIGIKDKNGKDTGEFLEFDLEDIETPLKYNQCDYLIKKAKNELTSQLVIIDKRPDKKGKYLLSANEEAKVQAIKTFFKQNEEVIDIFAGKGATNKLFGTRRYLSMFDDFNDYIEPFLPKLKVNLDNISSRIKNKYNKNESGVLTDE